MGFEYEAHLSPAPSPSQVRALYDALAARWRVVRRDDREIALAHVATGNPAWPESVVVQVEGGRVYVLFHTGPDRPLLEAIAAILGAEGLACAFDEL